MKAERRFFFVSGFNSCSDQWRALNCFFRIFFSVFIRRQITRTKISVSATTWWRRYLVCVVCHLHHTMSRLSLSPIKKRRENKRKEKRALKKAPLSSEYNTFDTHIKHTHSFNQTARKLTSLNPKKNEIYYSNKTRVVTDNDNKHAHTTRIHFFYFALVPYPVFIFSHIRKLFSQLE